MQIKVRQTGEVLEVQAYYHDTLIHTHLPETVIAVRAFTPTSFTIGVDCDIHDPEKNQLLLEVKRLKEALVAIASDAFEAGANFAITNDSGGTDFPNKEEYLNSIK